MKLGRFHRTIGAPCDYFGVMGPIFIHVVSPCLEKRGLWNDDMEEAWLWLFSYISSNMSHGYKGLQFDETTSTKERLIRRFWDSKLSRRRSFVSLWKYISYLAQLTLRLLDISIHVRYFIVIWVAFVFYGVRYCLLVNLNERCKIMYIRTIFHCVVHRMLGDWPVLYV